MEINGVDITHPEKILYPELAVTKQQVAQYYNFIAEFMLPFIKDRPLSLLQFPHGISKEGFFHKHAAKHYPSYIKHFDVPTSHHCTIEMIGITNAKGLVYMATQNTIEIHTGLATIKKIKCPDQIIIDLDPSDNDFEKVRQVALITKQITDNHDLPSYVKTTGSRGLHIHIPLKPKQDFESIKPITKQLAVLIHEAIPELTTIEIRKIKRGNKVFIDYLRNDLSATAVAPYSLRANKWAGIATPITWDEVAKDKKLVAYKYNIKNIDDRVNKTTNPWADWRHT
jgi:bifunctional non-homologous end joining protein LigD